MIEVMRGICGSCQFQHVCIYLICVLLQMQIHHAGFAKLRPTPVPLVKSTQPTTCIPASTCCNLPIRIEGQDNEALISQMLSDLLESQFVHVTCHLPCGWPSSVLHIRPVKTIVQIMRAPVHQTNSPCVHTKCPAAILQHIDISAHLNGPEQFKQCTPALQAILLLSGKEGSVGVCCTVR